MTMCARQLESGVTLIVGMGVTGISCARYLQQQGKTIRIADSRDRPPQWPMVQNRFAGCEMQTGAFKPELLENVSRILLSPGIPLKHPFIQLAVTRGIEVIGDIELFARNVSKPVIAITGSNGKSTVTSLLGQMLNTAGIKAAVGGNIGVPALDLLQQQCDAYVLELSSFQLETTHSLKPAVATVLNISEDHMDRYSNLSDYAESKSRIFQGASCCVINRDDSVVMSMPVADNAARIYFTQSTPQASEFGITNDGQREWMSFGTLKLVATDQLKLIGRHNVVNALAALALARGLGVEPEQTLSALRNFPGLEHRCQWVAEERGIRWINDSKATNTGSARAAIESMPGQVVLIGGGDGKGADFGVLREVVKNKVRAAILFGQDAERMQAALHDVTECHQVGGMQEAVTMADKLAVNGDTVLLAPACASLDMYENYMQRGEEFIRCVSGRLHR